MYANACCVYNCYKHTKSRLKGDARRQRDMCFCRHFFVLIHVRPVTTSAQLFRSSSVLIFANPLPCQLVSCLVFGGIYEWVQLDNQRTLLI